MTENSWLHWRETIKLVEAFQRHPDTLRFVGGAVRDTLLGRPVCDIDAATTLLPDEVMALLQKLGIRAIPTGIKHGTITALIEDKTFEITTLRKDVATDGRHAEVVFTDNWKIDAARRDFTMNAMYLSPEGELFDYFGGREDAEAGIVRFIGDAATRIREDYLRILRYFRFLAHYGKNIPDPKALAACAVAAHHLDSLSRERIQYEISRLLNACSSSATIRLMREHHIWPYILGFDITDESMFTRFEMIKHLELLTWEADFELAGFIFRASIPPEKALAKLFSRKFNPLGMLKIALAYKKDIHPEMPEFEQKRLIRKLGVLDFECLIVVAWADSNEPILQSSPYAHMIQLAHTWQPPIFPVRGQDLLDMGMKPGKGLGDKLTELELLWERSEYRLTKEELLSFTA